jgi:beta-glucanase (GH16 family)
MILRAEYKPNTTSYWYPGSPYPPVTGAYDYFSGAIESIQKFKYGYFEMRCTIPPPNKGNFPAFWLWSGTNRYSEIDIFEHTIHEDIDDYKEFTGSYYDSYGEGHKIIDYTISSGELPLTNFHTYAIEWSPKIIIWYFDGKQIGAAINELEITDEPMPIKINFALDNYVSGADNNLFPLDMKIDYIKVYQLECDCNSLVSITNSSQLNGYAHSVKKKITIENSSSVIKVQGEGISLRATDEITINGNFEVPLGTEFFATTHGCPQ